jgi:hypothetical protein
MAASGIVTPHRPEVIARRDREQRARDVAAQRLKDQQWLEQQRAAGRLGTPQVREARMHPDRRG